MPRKKKHSQVKVLHPHYGKVQVDEEMASLIEMMWEEGIDTLSSCQGKVDDQFSENRRAYVAFPNGHSFEAFVVRIMSSCDHGLKQHLSHARHRLFEEKEESWRIDVGPMVYGHPDGTLEYEGMCYAVRFPSSDTAHIACVFAGVYVS